MLKKSKKVTYKNIGIINFVSSNRAKRINISIKPFKGIIVKVPLNVSFKRAEKFVLSKNSWLTKHLPKMKIKEQNSIQLNKSNPITKEKIVNKIIKRTIELADRHNFKFRNLKIKDQKTIWGSCSSKNNINLNRKLVHLPDHLIDYVILHELTHTLEKNHSPKFWKKLDKFVENPKKLDKELKRFPIV
ncbi:MAG: YgjP-like metallopeptidase domain-containing protein [Candidatus Marinimicrobia bacterium]|nr:YgjP-like metallopeptidase domain-containing protein [Candidatus Neomarinimicrobiota bacterium]